MTQLTVFSIQRYSLHDGPGIRTIVFVKGCPLRCRWCCNPESQRASPELFFMRTRCIGAEKCSLCKTSCLYSRISFTGNFPVFKNRDKCPCGSPRNTTSDNPIHCVAACPSRALEIKGELMTVSAILDTVEQDELFFRDDGGLTVSGGEPLAHGSALIELLQEAKLRRLNTAIETCGFAEYEILKEAANYLDFILYDIKSLNEAVHEKQTGRSNKLILENFSKLCSDFPALPKLVRTPLIPGFNDNPGELEEIRALALKMPNTNHQTLPYHRLGESKRQAT